jgi:hypothetical protein
MPETPPPPPRSLPTPSFNFDPTRTQAYEFGLPPFEEADESEVVESPPGEPAWGAAFIPPAEPEAEQIGTGTGDLSFTPSPPPISDEPLEAAFADTAPLNLGDSAAAFDEEMAEAPVSEEPSEDLSEGAAAAAAEEVPDQAAADEEESVSAVASLVEEAAAFEAVAEPEAEPGIPVEDAVEPAPEAAEPAFTSAVSANGSGGLNGHGTDLLGVPSDVIDEIVRRTVERMSDDVIREIAWEVVPDLAARMIRKRLEGQQ